MPEVVCEIVRWVDDEPQPGVVETKLVDLDGRHWSFLDKATIFCTMAVGPSSGFPLRGFIRCEVIEWRTLPDGRTAVTIDTTKPDGVDSQGVTTFQVLQSALRYH